MTTKTNNEWEKRLRDYFHANLSTVGEHWIDGMIKIVNGVLASERQRIIEEIEGMKGRKYISDDKSLRKKLL